MQKYFLFILTNLASIGLCKANGILSVDIFYYNNPTGMLEVDSCCDTFCWPVDRCDYYFILCLDKPEGSSTDMDQCRIGKYKTKVYWDKNTIQLRNSEELKELKFHTWQGGMQLKVQVWDKDSSNDDDFVEFLSTQVQMDAVGSRSGKTWKNVKITKRTSITIKVAAQCDENWYGRKCEVYCKPSDDENGHYNCTSDGHKHCHENWYGGKCEVYCKHLSGDPLTNDFKGYPSQEIVSVPPFRSVTLRQMPCIAECARTCGCTCVSVSSGNKCNMFDVQSSDISRSPKPDSKVFVLFKA